MTRKRKKRGGGQRGMPRLHKMKRAGRLESARVWLENQGHPVRIAGYALRYGVDDYTAYQEMVMIGATIDEQDHMYAFRPSRTPRRRRDAAKKEKTQGEVLEELGIINWCGYLVMSMGETEGGAPYGLMGEDLREFLLECGYDWDWLQEPWESTERPIHDEPSERDIPF